MSGLKNLNSKKRSIIIVGKNREEKIKKAYTFVSSEAIVKYANEYDIEDNFSIPSDTGIIIEEVEYKPNIDLIKKNHTRIQWSSCPTVIQSKGCIQDTVQYVPTKESDKESS